MVVSLNNEYGRELPADVLQMMEQVAKEALDRHDLPATAEVSLTLCDDQSIHALNKQWRDVDAPTDVLSFPLLDGQETQLIDEMPVGDIIISVERASAQAIEFGHSLERELLYLFAHGMLHLLGYDHMEEEDRRMMREEEESLLAIVGAERHEL
jgi:probable rRNA maturation factor